MTQPADTIPAAQDLLALARDHEAQEMRRYRRLAFRFLPFGQGISRLMAGLGIACEHRQRACEQAATSLGLTLPAETDPERAHLPAALPGVSCWLILGQGQAAAVLRRTQAAAERSYRFSRQCREALAVPPLSPLWQDLMRQKEAECHRLQALLAAGAAAPRGRRQA